MQMPTKLFELIDKIQTPTHRHPLYFCRYLEFLTCSIDPFVVLQNKYLNQVYSSIGIGGQEQISIADMKKYVDLISPENQILHE